MRKWDEADCEAGSLISRGPIPGGRGSLPLMAQIRMVLCSAPDGLPLVCRPVSCACRNLRIRMRVTLGRVEVQAPDLRGHWTHKDENSVDPALILRLRQNRAYGPSGAVYNLPSSPQIRGGTRSGPRQGRCQQVLTPGTGQDRPQGGRQGGAGRESRGGGPGQVPDQGTRRCGARGS